MSVPELDMSQYLADRISETESEVVIWTNLVHVSMSVWDDTKNPESLVLHIECVSELEQLYATLDVLRGMQENL